jgi:hypothetical protein
MRYATAFLMVLAAAVLTMGARTSTVPTGQTSGYWVEAGNPENTTGTLYATPDSTVLGFYRTTKGGKACDFAIAATKDGVTFQVVDDKGKVHHVPVTALLNLADGGKKDKDGALDLDDIRRLNAVAKKANPCQCDPGDCDCGPVCNCLRGLTSKELREIDPPDARPALAGKVLVDRAEYEALVKAKKSRDWFWSGEDPGWTDPADDRPDVPVRRSGNPND